MSAPTATPTPQSHLDKLFPVPKNSNTLDGTTLHPGTTEEGGKALVKLLKDDYERHHIFFNDRGFHNHSTHHLYAIWTLGAQGSLLDAAYQTHVVYQRPSFDSPGEITEANWKDHLHDEKYYRAYLKFFSDAVAANGVPATLEKYVFAPESNIIPGLAQEKQPKMANRFMSGLLHPFIHAGYAAEFGTPGMLAEGLSMAALTETGSDHVVPDELFTSSTTSTLSKLTSALSLSSGITTSSTSGTNSFALLARMEQDPALAPGVVFTSKEARGGATVTETLENGGKLIWKYAEEWAIDGSNDDDIKVKLEELSWIATLIYGVGGLQPGQDFKANFVFMHLVTSSLFNHSFVKILSPKSRVILLRTYLAVILLVWISRGRPTIDIKNFYETTTPYPQPPKVAVDSVKPDPETLDPEHLTPNPWLPILQTTLQHPNEHLPKFQRALSLYSTWYGTTEKGYWKDRAAHLKNADLLDGTLFIRVAGLTADKLGWVREGQKKQEWEFNLF